MKIGISSSFGKSEIIFQVTRMSTDTNNFQTSMSTNVNSFLASMPTDANIYRVSILKDAHSKESMKLATPLPDDAEAIRRIVGSQLSKTSYFKNVVLSYSIENF